MSEIYDLDQNELLFLHTLFESPFVWGIQVDFEDSIAEQKAMETAFLTLQEKSYVQIEGEELYMLPELWTLMNASIAPEQILSFTYVDHQDEQDLRFFYWDEDILVEDRILPSNSRQLQRVDLGSDLALSLKALLRLSQQPQAIGTAQMLSTAVLEEVHEAALQEKDVVDKLTQAGMDKDSATSLAQAYTKPVSNTILTRIVPTEEEAVATSVILLDSGDGMWEIHHVDETQVQLMPVDADMAYQIIAQFFGVEVNSMLEVDV